MYVLSWRTVAALIRVLFLCLFPSLLHNSGNKHNNNPLVSAETVRHLSTYIIIYVLIIIFIKSAVNKLYAFVYNKSFSSSYPSTCSKLL